MISGGTAVEWRAGHADLNGCAGALPLDRMIAKQYDSLDNIVEGVRALEAAEIRGRSTMVCDTP